MTYKLLDDTPAAKTAAPKGKKFVVLDDEFAFDPMRDMSTTDRFLAGAGKAMTDTLQGAGQMLDLASREDVAEKRRLDAPLAGTTAGAVGGFAGSLASMAPAMLAGGSTIPVAAAMGAGLGFMQPSTSTGETILNTVFGGAGGAAGQGAANMLGRAVQSRAAGAAAKQAAQTQKLTSAQDAMALGYVIPPVDIKGGWINNMVSGLSGKIKTGQEASVRNQLVTDELARKAIGLKAVDQLDENVLAGIRKQAGQAYGNLRNAGQMNVDGQYIKALDNLATTNKGASNSFPGLKDNGLSDLIDTMKQPGFMAGDAIDATIVLREMADKSFRNGDKALGKAQKAIATELEDVMERQLLQGGSPDVVKQFQDARKLIAKTYSVQKALNSETGNVSAEALKKQMLANKPLSDELLQIAQANQAFPKATQALKEAPGAVSPLDWAVAAGTASSQGPMGLATLAARPATRNLLLSRPVQSFVSRSPSANTRPPLISNDELLRLMLGGGGIQAGLAGAEFVK